MSDHTHASTGHHLTGASLGDWLTSRDHKKIGLMFLIWSLGLLLLGSLMAVFFKASLGGKGSTDPAVLGQLLTYHGVIMVFMVIVPLIPSSLGNFLLPLQLGAKNMAMPGLSRGSFWAYVVGSILVLASLATHPVGTGWSFNGPYTLVDGGAFSLMAFGLFCIAASWVATGVNFILTVHYRRASGLGFFQMPIFSWSIYLTGYVLTLAGSIFAIVILYLASAKASGQGLFSAGTNPLDWQNYLWFVVTSAVFFSVIPAIGVMTDIISGISRKAVVGYRMVVTSLVMLLSVSLVSWGVNMMGTGQDAVASFTFAALALFAIVPVALIVYSWLATLYRGSIACSTPTAFVLFFLINAGIGTVLGLFLGNLSLGSYLSLTTFKTAQIHYLLMGGVVTALLAGLYYWWPTLTGKSYNMLWGRLSGLVFTVGVNLAFFPQIIMGAKGTAPATLTGAADIQGLQSLSSIGAIVLVVGLASVGWNLMASFMGASMEDSQG